MNRNMWGATAAALAICAGTAFGQYRDLALRNNNAQGRNFGAELRARNSVVYGTAPGGMSFQGNLGYRDPGEFQEYLGSNNLYNFRRNSAYSGAGGQGIRSSDILAYRSSLAVGNSGGVSPVGDYLSSIPRNFDSIPRQQLLEQRNAIGNSTARYGQLVRSAYQAEQVQQARDVNRQLGRSAVTNSNEGEYIDSQLLMSRYIQTHSFGRDRSVQKARYLPTLSDMDSFGLERAVRRHSKTGYAGYNAYQTTRTYDQQTLVTREERLNSQRDLTDRLRTPLDAVEDRDRRQQQQLQQQSGAGSKSVTPHDRLNERLEEHERIRVEQGLRPDIARPNDDSRALPGDRPIDRPDGNSPNGDPLSRLGTEQPGVADWQTRMDKLRTNLRADVYRKDAASLLTRPDMGSPLSASRRASARELLASRRDPLAQYSATDRPTARDRDREAALANDPETQRDLAGARIDPETLRMIRDAGGQVETLIPAGVAGRDLYAEHVAAGEQAMAASRFFDAADRFNRAVSLRPGDVTASIGRVHAQMGAGLYASAGEGLRRIFSEHPETVAQRYVGSARPDEKRAHIIVDYLRAAASPNSPSDNTVRREAALLLAYAGFQMSDRKAVDDGLTELRRLIPTDPDPQSRATFEALSELLNGVWLDEKFYKAVPAAVSPLDPTVPAAK